MFIAKIAPNTKPRMTQSDRWKKRPCVLRYRAFCDKLRLAARKQKFELGDSYKIYFCFKMPENWNETKKMQMQGKAHQEKPDLDNLIKAVNDAFCKEDKTIYKIEAVKAWDCEDKIIILNN